VAEQLNLLRKFQDILQRESLRADLDDKFNIIFQTYGGELDTVQGLYERYKHAPPVSRNLPPVAGNITWSRHLLKRIEEPMKRFEANQNVLASKDAKRIIKTYNKVCGGVSWWWCVELPLALWCALCVWRDLLVPLSSPTLTPTLTLT
jgi:dynein heavy chain